MLAMTEEPRGRGRPPKPTGRRTVLQAGFEPEEAADIAKIAAREEQPISAVVRELALEGLKARRASGRRKTAEPDAPAKKGARS